MAKRKAINFDLSTKELKKYFDNTAQAYNQIKEFMFENSFEHKQYSGYVSKEALNKKQVSKLIEKLKNQLTWLPYCVVHFDITDIAEQYDLTEQIKTPTTNLNEKQKDIRKQKK